jgi:hypothetical protein
MADTTALEAVAARHGGSSPLLGTIKAKAFTDTHRKRVLSPLPLGMRFTHSSGSSPLLGTRKIKKPPFRRFLINKFQNFLLSVSYKFFLGSKIVY